MVIGVAEKGAGFQPLNGKKVCHIKDSWVDLEVCLKQDNWNTAGSNQSCASNLLFLRYYYREEYYIGSQSPCALRKAEVQ